MTTYGTAAARGFDRLINLWGHGEPFTDHIGQGFWHAGNTLHTCIEYLLLDPPSRPNPIVAASFDLFEKYRDTDPNPAKWGFWRDDYGWWGRSLLLAYRHAEQLQLTRPDLYLKAAHLCWQGLQTAWDPRNGGCWNTPDHNDPNCRQNSVTNELFLLLSLELAAVSEAPAEDYRTWAHESRAWFLRFDHSQQLYNDQGLVLETPGEQHEAGWVWSGDQGLYAACCAKATDTLGPSDPPGRYPDGTGVVRAASQDLFDTQGVLRESTSSTTNTDVDYATGKGVFFRSATNPELFPDNQATLTSAAYVWNRRPPNSAGQDQFGYDWNLPPGQQPTSGTGPLWWITLQAAGQDVITAAARVAPDTQIPAHPERRQ